MEERGRTCWCNDAVTLEDVVYIKMLHLDGDNSSSEMDGFHDLAPIMEKVAKGYVRRRVKTRYGVPSPGPSPPHLHRHRHRRKDPRVMEQLKANEESSRHLARYDKERRKECEDAVLKGIIPDYVKMIDDAFNSEDVVLKGVIPSSGTPAPCVPFSVKFVEGCRQDLSKPPFDEKSYYFPPGVIQKSLHSEDIAVASLGLAFFNTKFSDQPPYFLEVVYGQHAGIHWTHCNFRASQDDGSPSKLFFVELYLCSIVTFCCILEVIPQSRGCLNCPEDFVHPMEGGFLHGRHLNMDEDRNARLAESSGFIL